MSEMDDFPYQHRYKGDGKQVLQNAHKYLNDPLYIKWDTFDSNDSLFQKEQERFINSFEYKYEGSNVVLRVSSKMYKALDFLTDLYTEKARMIAHVDRFVSPYEYWFKNKDDIIERANKNTELSGMHHLERYRETIYRETRECTLFKISLVYHIIKKFSSPGDLILDPCSGWGDRAIGAFLAGVKYIGVDPNINLFEGYGKLKNDLLELDPECKIDFVNKAFENFRSPKKFKLVFTSPPFSDFEVYTLPGINAIHQSSFDMTHEQWMNKWFLPFLDSCISFLEMNGHLVLYISDTTRRPIVRRMLEKMNYVFGDTRMLFKGVIASQIGDKRPLPIFVWQKVSVDSFSRDFSMTYFDV